jgi:hypothetical protein
MTNDFTDMVSGWVADIDELNEIIREFAMGFALPQQRALALAQIIAFGVALAQETDNKEAARVILARVWGTAVVDQ